MGENYIPEGGVIKCFPLDVVGDLLEGLLELFQGIPLYPQVKLSRQPIDIEGREQQRDDQPDVHPREGQFHLE